MRKYIIGLLMGFVLATTISAHAEVTSLINKTVDGMFPVTVDGKSLGDAIVVDNKTYLPVREFGEATGYNVTFTENREVVMTKNGNNSTPIVDPNIKAENERVKKLQRIAELTNQISDLAKILEPYEKAVYDDKGQPSYKEKDALYTETKTKRDALIIERDALQKQIDEQQKQ